MTIELEGEQLVRWRAFLRSEKKKEQRRILAAARVSAVVGRRYGRVVVIAAGGKMWRGRCDCGVERDFYSHNLRRGKAKSCGCLSREIAENQSLNRAAKDEAKTKTTVARRAKAASIRTMLRGKTKQIILEAKSKARCADCDGVFPPEALQFDHIPERGPKVACISHMGQHGEEAVMAEIAKCEIVCANCHSVRTKARLQGPHRTGKRPPPHPLPF